MYIKLLYFLIKSELCAATVKFQNYVNLRVNLGRFCGTCIQLYN